MNIDILSEPPSIIEIDDERANHTNAVKLLSKQIKNRFIAYSSLAVLFSLAIGFFLGHPYLFGHLMIATVFSALLKFINPKEVFISFFVFTGAFAFIASEFVPFGLKDDNLYVFAAIFYVAMYIPVSFYIEIKREQEFHKDFIKGLADIDKIECHKLLSLKRKYSKIDSYVSKVQQLGRSLTKFEASEMYEFGYAEKRRIKQEKLDKACKELNFGKMMVNE